MSEPQLPPIPKATKFYLENGAADGTRNDTLFAATCQLRDARWPEQVIYDVLLRRAMIDGLTERDALKTIESAMKGHAPRQPAIDPSRAQPHGDRQYQAEPVQYHQEPGRDLPPVRYPLDESMELPEPIDDGAVKFLRTLYKEEEKIQLVVAKLDDDGKEQPTGNAVILPVKTWISKIQDRDGDLSKVFPAYDENGDQKNEGMYFSINPLRDIKNGRKSNNIARYDYALIEFDTISLKQQWQLIKMSQIPAVTVTYSGGKSIHALVRVDARSKEEYASRVVRLMNHFSEYDVDTQNKDPSRLSRIPGVTRGDTGNEQQLLALNIGCRSWNEWIDMLEDPFPDIQTMEDLYNDDMVEPPAIIDGLLHRQMSLMLGGSSKTYKSWTLIDMAVSVANGIPFWGMNTHRGKVLYINFEIQKYYMRERIRRVCQAKKCSDINNNLYIWNLRGQAQALEAIRPKFTKVMVNAGFSMVILDPIYKTLGDRDENAAGDINSLMNEMESLAVETGAAVVFASHFSKGNQSGKSAMDRVSGSGVFSRAPDTIVSMTEHESDGCYTVESTVRNHTTPNPFVVRMAFPLFELQTSLDPAKLKTATTKTATTQDEVLKSIVFMLSDAVWAEQAEVVRLLGEDGVSPSTAKRVIAKAVQEGKFIREKLKGTNGYRIRRNPSVAITY